MSLCPIPKPSKQFEASALSGYDKIIIAGGGLAAFFTAYEILRQAREAGRKLSVLMVADKLNVPCTAGSHVVLELEGMFEGEKPDPKIGPLLRRGQEDLKNTISRESISCRYSEGYEIKSKDAGELDSLVDEMIERGVYKTAEIRPNATSQCFNLPGYSHSIAIDSIGQVNMPELIDGLKERIEAMGGVILEGTRYEGHTWTDDGFYVVKTSKGNFYTPTKPFTATGAQHLHDRQDFPFRGNVAHSMGIVMGPLDPEDAAMMSNGPMAMCDTNLSGDVLWGGIDEKRFFTIGRGDLDSASEADRDKLLAEMVDLVESLYPGLTEKYPPEVSFGAMLVPENKMPVVGRLPDYDVASGWAGMGIVAGYAAAKAYAEWVVHERDDNLKIFENMQRGKFDRRIAPEPHPEVGYVP